MKVFLVLFISFAYATEFPKPKDRIIEEVYGLGLEQLNTDAFNYIMTFLDADKVLSLKILSRRIYRRVRKLWPEMELSTVVDIYHPGRSVDFSHIVNIKMDHEQTFFYNRAQLSCLREFSLTCSSVHNLQAVINLLPEDSLTSLKLENRGSKYSLISEINFPKLTYLKLWSNISLSHDAFSFPPNYMRVLKICSIYMDATTPFSLATALRAMDELEVLSLSFCTLLKDGLSAILENLPTSLEKFDIHRIKLVELDRKLSELGLKRLKEMKRLQKIDFCWIDNELALEIISNLPKCVTNIRCWIDRETLNVFKKRLGEFTNVKRINFPWSHPELFQIIEEIFPNLDEYFKNIIYE